MALSPDFLKLFPERKSDMGYMGTWMGNLS